MPGFINIQNMPVEYAPIIGTLMGLSQVAFLVLGGYLSDKIDKTLMIKLSVVFALLTALAFTASMIYVVPFGVLLILAGISGVAVFGGGAFLH